MTGDRRDNVARAYHFERLVFCGTQQIVVNAIQSDTLLRVDPFARVEAASQFQPMLEMELAILQIRKATTLGESVPAFGQGIAGFKTARYLRLPQMIENMTTIFD